MLAFNGQMFEITHRHQQVKFSLGPPQQGERERQPVLKELIKEPISLKLSDFYSLIPSYITFSPDIAILFNEQNGEFRIPGIIPFKNLSGDLSAATVTIVKQTGAIMATQAAVSASAEFSSSSRDQNVAQSKENMILSLIIYHLMPHKIKLQSFLVIMELEKVLL